jgi:hypothetical protein
MQGTYEENRDNTLKDTILCTINEEELTKIPN